MLATARALGLRRQAALREDRLHPFVRDHGGDQGKEKRKNELGTNASINPNTTKAAEITAAAPTARESKRLTECRHTGTDWV
jgi:hypothetical protein